ncbi:SDR family NAD(P)-dependent oxidoreductase [Rhodococcus zopfii]|uniref:Putative short-chain dehydrogenase/reductase n=1 Tax=Rhodococcus sp. PY11 TaxID=551544 RepID=B5MAD6_9NOCA|nr:SDR family NAD(P)-dependent oxidoreductase [Rhodococcus zopfii]CAR47864.1 putative short-chain dehydrogenase/reductase [Rhodococcus sp. PY11]
MSDGKVAFLTGAGSGIGRASAFALAEAGHAVMAVDIDEAAAAATAKTIVENGGRAISARVDVTDQAQIEQAVAAVVDRFGPLTAAVNSAGIQGDLAPIHACSIDNWTTTLAVNLTGTFLAMKAELDVMLANGGGSIVNLSSNFGLVGKVRVPAYNASKHGVVGLTKNAALDYAESGIRVNAVCPGPTVTPMLDTIALQPEAGGANMLREVEERVPMKRMGCPAEVAGAIAWLCSDTASWVTGIALPVDGGFVT